MNGRNESYFSSSTGAEGGSEGTEAAKAPSLAAMAAAALTLASNSAGIGPGGGGGGTEEGGAKGLYARGGGDGGDTGCAGGAGGALPTVDIARRRRYASSPDSGGGMGAVELADSPGMSSLFSEKGAVGCSAGTDASGLRLAVSARRCWYASSPVRVGSTTVGISSGMATLWSRLSFSSALDH